LNPKLELTIIPTQKAIKMRRNTRSLHFLLWLMIPPIWALPSLEGYLPITAPKGPLIFTHPAFPFQAETQRESSEKYNESNGSSKVRVQRRAMGSQCERKKQQRKGFRFGIFPLIFPSGFWTLIL